MNINKPVICCVICLSEDGKILLIKRGREPYENKWALISGVGYLKQGLTAKEGVYTEVVGDVGVEPTAITFLFYIPGVNEDVKVFSAVIKPKDVIPRLPYVSDVKWCSAEEVGYLHELAFEHSKILKKFLKANLHFLYVFRFDIYSFHPVYFPSETF